ncbi:hypothetical protein QTH87_04300 [Variovorax sp. J22P168]|uniref:DUF4124 domain-containing protein n=1 Tax=Variovorax jilinensis TaxID=3053513 RepID=UPI00257569CE|nr:DUF4124 domain-containing protein [Variovorax sp. J22P168]MDM0011656.1 hypothetical protein [Variovorax sp. J22P168]
MALLGLMTAANAEQRLIQCKDERGRVTMSDRGCDAPTVGQHPGKPVTESSLDRLEAPDIFRARAKVREGDTAMPPAAESRTGPSKPTQTY